MNLASLAPLVEAETRALRGEGVAAGDRVGWIGPNEPAMLAALLACEKIGAAFVPLNWRLAPEELRWIAEDAGLRVVRRAAGFEGPEAAPVPQREADGTLLLGYTSGTTGRPKGACLSAEALRANAENARLLFDLSREDRVLTVLPLFHVGGLCIQTLPALSAGADVRLLPKFDADACFDAIAAYRPTLTLLVPAVMGALVSHPRWAGADLSSLRSIGAGSSEVPIDLIEAFHAKDVPVQQVYGMTETGPIAIAQTLAEALAAPGSIGRAAPLGEARILRADGSEAEAGEAGEIVVRGPNVMQGYWRNPAATAEALRDGWFRTGDVGHRDAEGRYWFTDRLTRVIISGGENIYPAELERVLRDTLGVVEAAVIGRPDARWGEVPVAVVVPGPGFEAGAVLRHFEGRLARFKHPRAVVAVDALPRTALGKVQLGALKELVDGSSA